MTTKTILIVLGEPNSTFTEILFKYFNSNFFKKNNNKIVLLGCKKLLKEQMKILKYKIDLNIITNIDESIKKKVNIINVNYEFKKAFTKITSSSKNYIDKCFDLSLSIIENDNKIALINGPVSKKYFLKKRFPGITEYISNKTNSKDPVMLIYNKNLSVSPITTHIPLKNVNRYIKKKNIINSVNKINNFYRSKLKKNPHFAVLGLNPHCETISKISEEKREIIPAIKNLKKRKIKIVGPLSADTFFLKKNIKKFDVVIGMYHDQVLTPIKTLYKFDAINITIGLPFIKVTPDHGPNHEMIGKNISDPKSFFYAIDFINNIK